jgi:four helix bundle protein
MQDYRRLRVWQKAHVFALDVHRLSGSFPRREGGAVTGQLRRAALSIPANIAEGAAKGSDAEFRRFLNIAMGSAQETDYHLLAAHDMGLLSRDAYEDLVGRCLEVRRMLGGLLKRIDAKRTQGAPVSTPSVT